jgi:hypothetical protein
MRCKLIANTRLVYKRTSIADEMREEHRRRVLGEYGLVPPDPN